MSNSESPADFTPIRLKRPTDGQSLPFRVEATQLNKAPADDARIVVLNGWDEQVGESFGSFSANLPRGLYTVRLERGGATSEEVVRHTGPGPSELHLMEPMRNSALPSYDTVDAHEYYSWTAAGLSQNDTKTAPSVFGNLGPGNPRLFIFVRAENATDHDRRDLAEALFLYGLDGRLLTDFAPEVVERDDLAGWVAFSAAARAGTYLLRHAGLDQREMVLTVYPNWDTQLFVPFSGRPLLERASLLLAHKGQGFHPYDRSAQAIDSGLAGLQSGVDLLPREAREMLLYGKFDNPMLGLIGAHLLLLHEQLDKNQLEIVLGNLDYLLPGAADVKALWLALSLRLGETPPPEPVNTPPMLRRGMSAVLQASALCPEIVPEGGYIEHVAPYLIADSAWSISSPPSPVAGLTLDDPSDEVNKLAGQFLDKEFRADRKKLPSAKKLSSIIEKGLPPLLDQIGSEATAGLSQGIRELANASVERALASARNRGNDALRLAAKEAMLRGVDAALRAHPERAGFPGSAADIPTWIRRLLEDASNRSREQGKDLDLAELAREAGLPLGALQRWLRNL